MLMSWIGAPVLYLFPVQWCNCILPSCVALGPRNRPSTTASSAQFCLLQMPPHVLLLVRHKLCLSCSWIIQWIKQLLGGNLKIRKLFLPWIFSGVTNWYKKWSVTWLSYAVSQKLKKIRDLLCHLSDNHLKNKKKLQVTEKRLQTEATCSTFFYVCFYVFFMFFMCICIYMSTCAFILCLSSGCCELKPLPSRHWPAGRIWNGHDGQACPR